MKTFNKTDVIFRGVSLVLIGIIAVVAVWSVGGLGTALRASAAGPAPINLGTAGNFVILTKSGVSTTGSTVVVGDIGVSPAPASYITGFALMLPAASASSTSAQVTGKIYAPDYANPTLSNLTTSILDMQNAYTDGMGRAPGVTELGAGNIGGLTLAPGTYKWGTNVTIPTNLTLSGSASDVWIFQVAQNLTISSATQVILSGGAQASNVFWVVAGQTTIGTGAVFNGTILDQTAIVLNTGAQLNGRALAQTAVTLDSNYVISPSTTAATPTPAADPASTPSSTTSTSSGQTMTTSTPTQTSSLGQAVVLGNGQTVYLRSDGSFTNGEGQLLSGVDLSASAPTVTTPSTTGGYTAFSQNLWEGEAGADVRMLQQYLNARGYTVAMSGPGSLGSETTFFGMLTKAALAKFQAAVGISPAVGYFGPITRGYINAHY